jgi:hypothetical protein
VSVYFVNFLANGRSGTYFWATFFIEKMTYWFWPKNGLGHVLGIFFTNSSGHPDFSSPAEYPPLSKIAATGRKKFQPDIYFLDSGLKPPFFTPTTSPNPLLLTARRNDPLQDPVLHTT